jgi:hypothetical protein
MELLKNGHIILHLKSFAMHYMFVRDMFTAYHCRIGIFQFSGDNIDFKSHTRQFAMLLLLQEIKEYGAGFSPVQVCT